VISLGLYKKQKE